MVPPCVKMTTARPNSARETHTSTSEDSAMQREQLRNTSPQPLMREATTRTLPIASKGTAIHGVRP
jgi:hypothetical protein